LVMKPQSYSPANKRYPVLYLLHCAGGSHTLYLDAGYCEGLLKHLDEVNFIIVAPYDGTGFQWWLNSPVQPKSQMASFVVSELKPHIDSLFPTMPQKANTGVAGHSMGGFGTFHLIGNYPQTFGVGYAIKAGTNIIAWPNSWGLDAVLGSQSTHLANWQQANINTNTDRYKNTNVLIKFYSGRMDSWFYNENNALDSIFRGKGIAHEYAIRDEAHCCIPESSTVDMLHYFESSFSYSAKAISPHQSKNLKPASTAPEINFSHPDRGRNPHDQQRMQFDTKGRSGEGIRSGSGILLPEK